VFVGKYTCMGCGLPVEMRLIWGAIWLDVALAERYDANMSELLSRLEDLRHRVDEVTVHL